MDKHKILDIATKIRGFLTEEFPDNKLLKNQCKRAAILVDMYFKKEQVNSYPIAGFITKDGDTNNTSRGHVWNIVYLNDECYLLDITLTQFSQYLQKEVPDIVFLPYQEAIQGYSFKSDGKGKYEYRFDDVRLSLVAKLNSLV